MQSIYYNTEYTVCNIAHKGREQHAKTVEAYIRYLFGESRVVYKVM